MRTTPVRARVTPGVVVFSSGRRAHFQREHELLLSALLEPLAVAVESDHRIRELTALCEAAEADKRSLLARLRPARYHRFDRRRRYGAQGGDGAGSARGALRHAGADSR